MPTRILRFPILTLFLLVAGAATLSAQSASQGASQSAAQRDLLTKFGASPLAPAVTFPLATDLDYRIAWGISKGPEKADSIVPDLKKPANFLFLADKNGLPREKAHLAIVIWGTATHSLLKNEAYRAAKGTDNGSIAVLEALNAAGVQVIVCGEALVNRGIDPRDLLPFVRIAPTAAMGLATLNAQGYATYMP